MLLAVEFSLQFPTRNVVLRLYLQRFHDLVVITFIMTPWTRRQEREIGAVYGWHAVLITAPQCMD